jgi:ribosomal-protein-alanine N-acetyltransferase
MTRDVEIGTQPVLVTDRLVLRPFEPGDASMVQRLVGVREVADTTLNIPHPYPDGAAEAWIASHLPSWVDGAGVTYAITRKSDGGLLGAIGLVIAREHARAELGYWIAVDDWNRGYCTEAGRAVLAFAFDTLQLNRVHAAHYVRNPASGQVMQKLGMTFEGIQREAVRKTGHFEDVALHAILAREWVRLRP